jgi:hypothetical protein
VRSSHAARTAPASPQAACTASPAPHTVCIAPASPHAARTTPASLHAACIAPASPQAASTASVSLQATRTVPASPYATRTAPASLRVSLLLQAHYPPLLFLPSLSDSPLPALHQRRCTAPASPHIVCIAAACIAPASPASLLAYQRTMAQRKLLGPSCRWHYCCSTARTNTCSTSAVSGRCRRTTNLSQTVAAFPLGLPTHHGPA